MRNLNLRYAVPQPSTLPQIICDRHQAPHGYQYVLQSGVCVLVHSATGQIVHAQAGLGVVTGSGAGTVAASVLPSVSSVTNWLQANKGLALAIAASAYYFATKK